MKKYSLLFSACILTFLMLGSSYEALSTGSGNDPNECNPTVPIAILHGSTPISICSTTPVNMFAFNPNYCGPTPTYHWYFPSTGHSVYTSTLFMSFIPNGALVVGSNTVELSLIVNNQPFGSPITATVTGTVCP